jgi:hypothetical protein
MMNNPTMPIAHDAGVREKSSWPGAGLAMKSAVSSTPPPTATAITPQVRAETAGIAASFFSLFRTPKLAPASALLFANFPMGRS